MRARSARVILVNWKNAPLTLRAAHSIAPQMGQGDHLVIVDNGSDDDSLTVLRDGLLVPATDASALAEALEAAAGSEHDRLAAAGIERARDYTWEASAAAHAAIYASLAGAR